MGYSFPDEFLAYARRSYASQTFSSNSLEAIVAEFPSKLKQALYAAAEKGWMRKGTWTGCAFNRAGQQISTPIHSTATAAAAFRISQSLVGRFIHKWDSIRMGDRGRTQLLKECLEQVGLATPPHAVLETEMPGPFEWKQFKSAETRFREQLEHVETIDDIPDLDDHQVFAAINLIQQLDLVA